MAPASDSPADRTISHYRAVMAWTNDLAPVTPIQPRCIRCGQTYNARLRGCCDRCIDELDAGVAASVAARSGSAGGESEAAPQLAGQERAVGG